MATISPTARHQNHAWHSMLRLRFVRSHQTRPRSVVYIYKFAVERKFTATVEFSVADNRGIFTDHTMVCNSRIDRHQKCSISRAYRLISPASPFGFSFSWEVGADPDLRSFSNSVFLAAICPCNPPNHWWSVQMWFNTKRSDSVEICRLLRYPSTIQRLRASGAFYYRGWWVARAGCCFCSPSCQRATRVRFVAAYVIRVSQRPYVLSYTCTISWIMHHPHTEKKKLSPNLMRTEHTEVLGGTRHGHSTMISPYVLSVILATENTGISSIIWVQHQLRPHFRVEFLGSQQAQRHRRFLQGRALFVCFLGTFRDIWTQGTGSILRNAAFGKKYSLS